MKYDHKEFMEEKAHQSEVGVRVVDLGNDAVLRFYWYHTDGNQTNNMESHITLYYKGEYVSSMQGFSGQATISNPQKRELHELKLLDRLYEELPDLLKRRIRVLDDEMQNLEKKKEWFTTLQQRFNTGE